MARTFEFAVLRLAPDAVRGEAVNLGIVVFNDGKLDIRVGEVLTRARLLYPEMDADTLSQGVGLFERMGSVSLPVAEKHRSLSRLGAFQLGELGHFTVADGAGAYEERVLNLLRMFVAVPRAKGGAARASNIVTAVRKEFRKAKVLAAIGDAAAISEHKIVPEWPIPNRPSLKANFALKNSVMRVCELVDLDLSDDAATPPAFFAGVVTLDVAKREAGAKQTVFAYRAKGPASRIDEALRIAEPHATELVDWNQKTARETFMHDWILAARVAVPVSQSA